MFHQNGRKVFLNKHLSGQSVDTFSPGCYIAKLRQFVRLGADRAGTATFSRLEDRTIEPREWTRRVT
jgi:hypothetical protein